MMTGNVMGTHVELWPVAADEFGIWLASGTDAWDAGPVLDDSEPYLVVRALLQAHDQDDRVQLLHQTSERTEFHDGRSRNIQAWVAVLGGLYRDPDDALTLDIWPDAQPFHPKINDAVGHPFPHDPALLPEPRKIDVLRHAIRHLKFVAETDAGARGVLCYGAWAEHLESWTPTLAGLYRQSLLGG